MLRRMLTVFLLTLAVTVFLATVSAEEPKASRAFYNTFSDAEEEAVGRNAAAQTEKTIILLRDPVVEQYLDSVGQKVARASQRPQLQYHFMLVDTPSMNAYSFPGGYVYVNRGLFDFVESESELASVLAHEVGHIVAYHGMNDVARRMLVDRVRQEATKAGLLQEQQAQDILQRYGGPVVLFVDRKFSREEENEADLFALYDVQRAGWTPQGLITFLNRLSQFSGNPTLIEKLKRGHPLPADRVSLLRDELKQNPPPRKLTVDALPFRSAKSRLQGLPPAQMQPK